MAAIAVVMGWHLIEERGIDLVGTGIPMSLAWLLATAAAVAATVVVTDLIGAPDDRVVSAAEAPGTLTPRNTIVAGGASALGSAAATVAVISIARGAVAAGIAGGIVAGALLAVAHVLLRRHPDSSARRRAESVAGLVALAPPATLAALVLSGAEPRLLGAGVIWVATVAGAFGGALLRRVMRADRATVALLTAVVAIWFVHDTAVLGAGAHFYDLKVYRAAGLHALAGEPVYLETPLDALPDSATDDYFLYPPPLIPLTLAAARIPFELLAGGFTIAMVICSVGALRLLGLRWGWVLLFLAFPPLVKGIESGNVASLAFLLFAAGYRYGPTLVGATLLKVQYVIPALWLVRERRWGALAIGLGVVGAICLVTLPLTGIESWHEWLVGLRVRQQTQEQLPILYGLSLGQILPSAVFLLVGMAAVALALIPRGRRGLAALGLASIVASPSLWPHGFLMALPALLRTTSPAVLWLALGVAAGGSLGLWSMAIIGGSVVWLARWDREIPEAPEHPLGGTAGPWSVGPRLDRSDA